MSINLGIIGAGRVAQEHVKGALAAGVNIAAIYDQQPEKALQLVEFIERTAAEREIPLRIEPQVCGSLDELLSRSDVPAAIVAVPNVNHCDVARQALQSGRDILLEKPMAMNLAECDAIIEAASANDRIVQMGFVCRGSPKVHAVRDIIASGALGEIYHIKASACRQRGIPGLGGWFTTRSQSGGGVLIDIGVHLLDLVMHLAGPKRAATVSGVCECRFGSPVSEYVFTEMWAGPPKLDGVCDVEDSAMALIRFDTGQSCEVNVAWASNMPENLLPDGLLLLGDRGGLFLDIWGDRLTLVTQQDGKVVEHSPKVDFTNAWDRAWQWQHERFAQAVKTRSKPIAPAQTGRAVQEIITAWQRSGETGREVAIGQELSTAAARTPPV